jgi:hypothetical protein
LAAVFVSLVREAQQQEGDEGDRNLDPDGVLGGPDEVVDFQGLLAANCVLRSASSLSTTARNGKEFASMR